MPRLSKYSVEMVVDALVKAKGSTYIAADLLGCTIDTVYRYVKKSKLVSDTIRHERQKVLDVAELKLYQAMQNGESWAICFLLKTQGRDRGYCERQEVSHEINVKTMSDEELQKLALGKKY